MRFIYFFTVLVFLASCVVSKNTQTNKTKDKYDPIQKTYAEISVKKGGEWKGRKYEGGQFINIQRLKVPTEHTDHSFYIRYEGPGWESNKIGYRLYLDWRNAIDIFGKLSDTIVLPYVGLDGFDSYHEMGAWGMDILRVSKGLGIGSIGRYFGSEVLHFKEVDSTFARVENKKDQSLVEIKYHGWKTADQKINFNSELSIRPDQRHTMHVIQSSRAIDGICTGIVNLGQKAFRKESENKKWAYLATYGEQTLVPDNLGMAVFYRVQDTEKLLDWQYDHLIIFKPTTNKIIFYFLGAWEKEKDGIKTQEDFIAYLDGLLLELNKKDKI